MRAMKSARLILPLLCALSLLFAQQVGAAHTLSHELEEQSQQHKHSSDSPACEKCAAYAQLGSALSAGAVAFTPPQISGVSIRHRSTSFQTLHLLAAVARGPPVLLQTHA
jgi:hypothetical protein